MQINPRDHPHMLLKTLGILFAYALCYYFAFFWSSSFLSSLVFAMGMGLFAAEVGISIQHDGNHGMAPDVFVDLVNSSFLTE